MHGNYGDFQGPPRQQRVRAGDVDTPTHYTHSGRECIDTIRDTLGDAFPKYCHGNALKYTYRAGHKGDAVQDLRKAIRYLEYWIEHLEKNQ